MRRAVVVALVLTAACSTPAGEERHGCNAEWLDVPPVATQVGGVEERALQIDCIGQIANRRLRIGFRLPGGPSCYILSRVELLESADAVSVTLIGAVTDDPNAGACTDDPQMVVTEVDLAAPVADRRLLDGSAVE
jgi:hypothetical protein